MVATQFSVLAEGPRRSVLMHNRTEQIHECFRQAAECAQHSDAQTDPKVKQQFLVLARIWFQLAAGFDLKPASAPLRKTQQ